ncbi:hypothetical protein [Runella slithyformis]|uniref:Glycosyltransferase RgtA/B/C/D-like domain-containing protein n=1 Tax=Runella slithyformis (strain ATCC 29530 / DSM 19594 / LMG 11500 / NCIMB 11436 / LSU 4) TaxID=761193 RepID=A0A7U3ZGY4_RUNSL|nr:hypothetical protein [Runella slithyformis]AEI47031.1 hypothetical protein Runsl_0588 [Runella slithyformis DSM 19594]
MLSFFRVNAPYQILSLVIVLVMLQFPFYISAPDLLVSELQWMLVGEKMGQGFMLYRDVWDNLSPLSAAAYWGIDELFGRSPIAHRSIANLLILFQAVYFNYISGQRQLFTERNYVPGVLYLLFINVSFDCSILSPSLMATTFILLAFGTLIRQMQREGVTDEVFELGFYLSVATLFYLPMGLFLLWAFLSMLLYTGANFRQHTLAFFGYVFPIALSALFFFFRGALDELSQNLLTSAFRAHRYNLQDFLGVIGTMGGIFLIGGLGFLQTIRYPRFINYQGRCQQIMGLWVITAFISIGLMPFIAPMQFIIFIPPVTFFSVNFFMLIQRRWLSEVLFLIVFVAIVFFRYQSSFLNNPISLTNSARLDNLKIKRTPLPPSIRQQKILVIGEDEGEYRDNFPATAYINWELARYDFENLDSYESVISIFDNFKADPPTYVVDKENVMPRLFKRLPELGKRYHTTQWKGIYQRNVQ